MTQCTICEKDFDRDELLYITLKSHTGIPSQDRSFYSCELCGLAEKANFYEEKFIEAKDALDRVKEECNLFRSVMLNAGTMETKSQDSLETPISHFIAQRRFSWESLSLDAVLHWLSVFESYARCFSEIAGKKASSEEIKAHLKAKSEESFRSIAKKATEPKTPVERVKLSAEDKAVKGLMKALGCSESQAREMVKSTL